LELTKIYLEVSDGLKVTTAIGAKNGLDLLRNNDFDIVVSDYQMPSIDGLELLRSVRAEFGDMPFILFTGKGREAVAIEALNSGADYYVQKGVDVEAQFTELRHKIKLAVNKRQIEGRLSDAERRLREMLEQIDMLSIQLDSEGHITYANRFASITLGSPVSEMLGVNFFDMFVQKNRSDEQKALYQKMMKTANIPKEMIGQILTTNGNLRTIRFKNSLIRDQWGKIIGMSNIGEDITDLVNTTEERDMLTDVIKASSTEIYLFDDEDLHITFMNVGALKNLGVTQDEITLFSPLDAKRYRDSVEFQEGLEKLRSNGGMVAYETEHVRKDGSNYPVEIHLQLFQRGSKKFFMAVGQDITARKKIENELRMSEARYRNLVENFSGTVFVAELDSKYPMNVYGQVKDLTGYEAADFEQHRISWVDVILPEDLHILLEQIQLMDMDHSHMAKMEFRIRRRDGNVRWVTSIWHIVSPEGNPVIQGMMIDITTQKSFEEELQSSNEELMAADEQLKQQLEELTDSEERLRLSEERFHNLFMAMDEGVAIHRLVIGPEGVPLDYVILDVNPSYEKILGLRKTDVQGRTGTDVYHAPSPYLHEFSMPERTGRSYVFETYFPPMDKYFHISVVRVGRERFATVFIDITEQKRREAAILANQNMNG